MELLEIIDLIEAELPGYEWLVRNNPKPENRREIDHVDAPYFATVVRHRSGGNFYFPTYGPTKEVALQKAYERALTHEHYSKDINETVIIEDEDARHNSN